MRINTTVYFLLWVLITTLTYKGLKLVELPIGWFLIPALGGLALYFWLNRDRPTPNGGAALVVLLVASSLLSSCNPQLATST